MIRIDFDPARLSGKQRRWWEGWERRAAAATAKAEAEVSEGRVPSFHASVWAEMKQWLFENVFAGKCAYCEGAVTPQSFGDAEHWRPKGEVTVREAGRRCKVTRDKFAHPGYWWLAYEWTNLLPACQRCNSGRGKGSQFPISGRHVFDRSEAACCEDLDRAEGPWLLHPLRGEDPADHLAFDEFGYVTPVDGSLYGRHSIDVYDLKRRKLVDDRCRHMHLADDGFVAALNKVAAGMSFDEATARWTGKDAPYSLAVRHYLHSRRQEFLRLLGSADAEPQRAG